MSTPALKFPRWLLRKPDDDAEARVFCLPYSGVGASMFNRWPRWLGGAGRVEVCPVQLPGRENRLREPHFGTYERLADAIVAGLHGYFDRPFVLFGHCAAALPAFETAVRLTERGLRTPSALVVSAQAPPHHCPHDRFLDLGDDELTAELGAIAVARGGTAHPDLMDLTLRVLHLDLSATRRYHRPVTPVPFPVTVVHWADDAEVDLTLLGDWRAYSEDTRPVRLPGGHYEFLSAPPGLLDLLAARALPAIAKE
ncbi:thioesterase II family protein [Amycolatopsis sp. lyj-109]|uniref:thioesterase II family protein n=1 Tax=Amycolatopsis sp. lyj-109 TaxID=2789287 RepID=UPI00397CC949